MQQPLRIGITGGIGSGKTTTCKLFSTLGIPIYYADDRAKWLMQYDPTLKLALINAFGKSIYDNKGQLDRSYLAGIVFNDQAKLTQLNGLVHPAVKEDGIHWEAAHQDSPYTLREAALLYESGIAQIMDKVITVTAPEDVRIARVMQRDQLSAEQVKARIDKQWPEEQKVASADYVIYNDGQQSLIRQVYRIHHQILNLHS